MTRATATVLIVAVVVAALLVAALLRWQVVAVASSNLPVAYLLDRWKGEVYIVGGGSTLLQPRERQ